jgi:hypothetical protein
MFAPSVISLEESCHAFTQQHNLSTYETEMIPFDGGQVFCIEASGDIMDSLIKMENRALANLRESGLALLMAEGVKGGLIKLYVVNA